MAKNRRKRYGEDVGGEDVGGIPCVNCGCRHSYVVRTEKVGEIIRRTRRCRHCGRMFFTTEGA
ncbi:MAG: hypothetical protein IJI54_05885 [Kiritimatiellae bacterium]|nr:hypothetical protein [Kiritimatiellia bacterium]